MMEIYKPNKELKKDFILAFVFGILLTVNWIIGSKVYSIIVSIVLFLSYLINAIFYKKNALLKIDDQKIRTISLFGNKEIFWNEVISKKYFAGEWKLIGKEKTILINKDLFSEKDWTKINKFITEKNRE